MSGRSASAGKGSKARAGARQGVAVGLCLAIGLFVLPGVVVGQLPEGSGVLLPTLPPTQTVPDPAVSAAGGSRDRGRIVRLARADGTVEELTMEEYLWGVAAAEMPAAFELEALKAQVAAARTYTVEAQNGTAKHQDAHLCDDSACCQAYVDRPEAEARWGLQAKAYGEKLEQAVSETDGLGVLYQEEPIQAVFFSSSAGRTVDAAEVWGSPVDYLKGVDSPEGEEVPNYRTQVSLTVEEVRQAVLAGHPGADLSGAPESWFGQETRNLAGGVAQVTIGGVAMTGAQARALFGLRSASFTVELAEGVFTFHVTGYGHGVGMSQYGANAMAKEGKDYQDILTWYYTGTEIGPLWT